MATQTDQRAAERFPINANSVCDFASPVLEDFGPVKVINVSNGGIGFVTTDSMPAGLLLAMRLVNANKKYKGIKLVRVVHVTSQPGGTYLIGGQFETPLPYDELCTLVM